MVERRWILEQRRLHDLVRHEIAQRRESGHDTAPAETRLAFLSIADEAELVDLYGIVLDLEARDDWLYDEPSDLSGICELMPRASHRSPEMLDRLDSRILGAWNGRIAGCVLGKPVEAERWTATRLREYLELAGAYPLLDYIPAMDPMPEGYQFRESWPQCTRGRIHGAPRDDDIDYTILALHLLEEHGSGLRTDHVASAWTHLLPYQQVFTAERAAYRNLVLGVSLSEVATFENPYREWIGAQIRGDMFGWSRPGDPRAAAVASFQDASLSHTRNGIYGEMWVAALCALAFTADTIPDALERSLAYIPATSRLAEAVQEVISLSSSGASWAEALSHIQLRYGQYHIVHTVNNAALITAGLLWGDHDFARIVGLTVQGGWDTDSNGATAGSVAGAFLGFEGIPERFVAPLNDRVSSAVLGYHESNISELATRTLRMIDQLEPFDLSSPPR